MKRRTCLVASSLLVIGLLGWAALTPAGAQAQSVEATLTPAPTVTPAAPSSQTVFHVLTFPFETMLEAIVQMSGSLVRSVYAEAESLFAAALEPLLTAPYGLAPESLGAGTATPLFRDLVAPHWQVAFHLALLLLPVTLALTAADALRQGAASTLGQIELKEALLGWLFAAGGAALSLYALGLMHRLSLSAAGAVLGADFGERVSGVALARAFFNAPALMLIAGLFPPAALYVGFFILLLGSTLLLALCLGLAAYTAVTYLLAVIAPVVLVLGALPPLRWLPALWLKTSVVVGLLPLADAFLLRAGLSLYRGFFDPDGGGGSVASFLASVVSLSGVLSVLIAINYKAAESIFGALAEVGRQAWAATTGVLQLALSTGALVAGFATGGALAAGLAAATTSEGPGLIGEASPESAAGAGTSSPSADGWRTRLASIEERARRWLERLGPSGTGPTMAPPSGEASSPAPGPSERQGQADPAGPAQAPATPPVEPQRPSTAPMPLPARDQATPEGHGRHGRTRSATPRATAGSQSEGTSVAYPVARSAEAGRAQPGPANEARSEPPSLEPAATGSALTHPADSLEPARRSDAQPADGGSPAPAPRPEFAPGASTASESVVQDAGLPPLDVPPALETEARLQRARLAQNFGRLLAATAPSPAGRAFGAGLQAAGLWAAYRAQQSGPAWETREPFVPSPTAAPLNDASAPDAGTQLGAGPHSELAEALRRSFGLAGRALDTGQLAELLHDVFATAGTESARRDFAVLVTDPENAASAGRFLGALSAWAERHTIALPEDLNARIARLFTDSADD